MSKKLKKIFLTILVVLCLASLTACGAIENNNGSTNTPSSTVHNSKTTVGEPEGEYKEGFALVKYDQEFTDNMANQLGIKSVSKLYDNSSWYTVEFRDKTDTVKSVNYLAELGCFEKIDYDYIMGADGPKEEAVENPNYKDQVNLGLSNIPNGWTQNGKAPGGSADVVVAVIDTGVDYTHLDLRNNIWINPAEIAGNGIDDDKNGYIDDIYGWNCVGDNNNPMDDNGHGTHVAGIIAAENNKVGGIGVAYNCKVMVLKAGNSSGYFNNSDIAEAIQYAYMNGASVINMSFGGSNISIAVEEALENAYNSCVLVAAAGNDGACNNLSCKTCVNKKVSYPAALPYVIGVMSVDKDGKHASSFSNYDHNPYDSIEYEVYAVGEGVGSTWPSNKYACLNGTSMAAPTVAGVAALLRSYYTDREMYATKFIQSQIVNTGTINPHIILGNEHVEDTAHSVADVELAMTKVPKPEVNLYGYSVDDSVSINKNNNGNGIVDAGETVRLYFSLHNRGGVATNVNVSIDTDRGMGMTDPYFTFVNNEIQLSDIGTYSVRESGDKYFEIIVDSKCPNDYLVNFNIRFTYENGLDDKDKTIYSDDGKQKAQFSVSKGYLLPATISQDTTFKADRLYIVGSDVVISEGVTVTFEEGCEIQFYDDREYYNSPKIINYGTLNFNGTQENMIKIAPNERYDTFACITKNYGTCTCDFIDAINFSLYNVYTTSVSTIFNSYLNEVSEKVNTTYYRINMYQNATITDTSYIFKSSANGIATVNVYDNCFVNITVRGTCYIFDKINSCVINILNGCQNTIIGKKFTNNIIYSKATTKTNYYGASMIEFGTVENNKFITSVNADIEDLLRIESFGKIFSCNTFYPLYQQYASQVINGYYDAGGNPTIDVYGECSDISLLYPHVTKVQLFNSQGEEVTTIGKEEITVRVTFNRAMDTTQKTFATFGTIEPYADYRIDGEYISSTVWEGKYTLRAQIENGLNYLKINNACQADDITKQVLGEYQLHEFTIDTTAAMSMNLFAIAKEKGVELTFVQDDYDTLLGYNIYRSTEKDGNYVKLNPTIILPTETTFLDENAEPGKTYWYTYTVVLSDFTESAPAGKVQATAMDTILPTIYHTPVNQGYQNNNLVISCTASDNVSVTKVTLYYRTSGASSWKSLTMSKVNDKYSATVFGSDVMLDGLEYYIVASDGVNTINKASAENPYFVLIKDASTISHLGDVDGDGTVSAKDALMLMQAINNELLLSDDEFKRADLNKDGILSSSEALRILQYINGNVNSLEM